MGFAPTWPLTFASILQITLLIAAYAFACSFLVIPLLQRLFQLLSENQRIVPTFLLLLLGAGVLAVLLIPQAMMLLVMIGPYLLVASVLGLGSLVINLGVGCAGILVYLALLAVVWYPFGEATGIGWLGLPFFGYLLLKLRDPRP
jgi:hypothetical protein